MLDHCISKVALWDHADLRVYILFLVRFDLTELHQTKADERRLLIKWDNTHRLQFNGDGGGVSAHGGHAPAEGLPDDSAALEGTLAAALEAPKPLAQRGHQGPGGEQGLHHATERGGGESHGSKQDVLQKTDVCVHQSA